LNFPRSFWLLFALGLAVRCVALTQPLVDAHLLRQCQTAAVTRSLSEEPGWHLSSRIPWAGDLDERFVLELPLYNYLVIAVDAVLRHLTLSGKLVAVALWALSFWLLQFIWRRALDPAAAVWANLLFVVSPLGVFYAQAFMPESLVQCLAHAFILLLLRYDEVPSLPRWLAAAAVGLLAVVVKATATAHLYVLLLVLLVARAGWRAVFRPRYVIAGILSAAGVVAWGHYLGTVNVGWLSFGDAGRNLRGFIGPLHLRFEFQTWRMIALYLAGFVIPGVAALGVLCGVVAVARRGCSRLLAAWLAAITVFYLLWLGNGPASQSYYNLPALGPICALFGLGIKACLESPALGRWRRLAAPLAVAATVGCAVPVWIYLFTPDRAILTAAQWAREHTEPGSVILYRAAHRLELQDYGANAVFPFYAERPSFIWVTMLPEPYRSLALERSRYAVVTVPLPASRMMTAIRNLRGLPAPPRESTDWLLDLGFAPVAEGPGFVAFRRQ
jgi:hypothetical protein